MSESDNCKHAYVDGEGSSGQQSNPTKLDPDAFKIRMENPLNNVLVLDVIFNHLPKENWKSARLVNRTWHSTLQARWRDRMNYKFGVVVKTHNVGHRDSPGPEGFTAQFLEQHHPTKNPDDPMQLSRYPIRNISIRWDYNNSGFYYPRLERDQTRFWELYGHGLKRIHFDGVRITQEGLLKRLLFELTPNLEEFYCVKCHFVNMHVNGLELNTVMEYTPPDKVQKNLKLLEINTANFYNDLSLSQRGVDYKPRFPISWIEFFSVFPNLMILKLEIDPPVVERPSDLLKLLEAIDIIREANDGEVLNITDLHLGEIDCINVDVIQNQLLLVSLPISTLSVDVTHMDRNQQINLVETFQSSLQNLTLIKQDFEDEYLPSHILPQGVTKLALMGSFFSSFAFLSCTPNLEELKMTDITYMLQPEVSVNLAAAVCPLMKLQKLEYILSDVIPLENMQILAKLSPNVKTVVCTVDADGFRALCHGWANLEHLDLIFDFEREAFFVEHLTKLKRLKSLKTYSLEITDHSVFEGFLKLPSLTKLQLPERISEVGFKALKQKNCETTVFYY